MLADIANHVWQSSLIAGMVALLTVAVRQRRSRVQTPAGSPAQWRQALSAIQEQLGLTLEPGRAALDVLIIDHAEKPKGD